ncbi:C25 family cysteine peptidase [Kribbella soli]
MAPPVILKVIVTNRAAARAKYGAGGWRQIRAAVTALVKADAARGITTRLIALDSAADARKVGAAPISAVADVAGTKALIDQIFTAWDPAYLMLLGGPELVCLVNLQNPLWTGDPQDDPDQFIPSDLPYACPAPLTFAASAYRGPTRVVSRMPDLTGVHDCGALLTQLDLAANARTMIRLSPEPVFAVSAKVWQVSTRKSIAGLPDVSGVVNTSPAEGPSWTKNQFAPRLHFVNCHGAEFDPDWYGQATPSNWNLPTALAAKNIPGLAGQVVAAECCYGSAHWPPSAAGGQAGLAMTYLINGAAGVFAATTVAYGPASTNNYADVMCRLFGEEVLNGASLGRAVLAARQRYVAGQPFMDPTDVKTLAQFQLLGDPSAVPFQTPDGGSPPAGRRRRSVVDPPKASAATLARRVTLTAVGTALDQTTLASTPEALPQAAIDRETLAGLVGRELPSDLAIRSFGTERTERAERAVGGVPAERSPRVHVAFVPAGRQRPPSLVLVREQPGADPEVRVVVRR